MLPGFCLHGYGILYEGFLVHRRRGVLPLLAYFKPLSQVQVSRLSIQMGTVGHPYAW